MVNGFDINEKQEELRRERETIQQEVAQLQADLQARSLANPEFNTRQSRQFINRRGEIADRLGREISILDGLRARQELAEREGQTIPLEEQQRFFEARSEQVQRQISGEFARQRQIIAQRGIEREQQIPREPTPAEIEARQSLLEQPPTRFQQPTPAEIQAQQSFADPFQREVTEEEFRRMQTLQPERADFGQSLGREGIQEVRLQSLPIGVVGGTQEFEFREAQPISRIEKLSVESPLAREVVIQFGVTPFGATPSERERARQSAVLRDISLVITQTKFSRVGVTKVSFTGVQQTIKADRVVTRVIFRAETGRKIQRGVATTVSDIIPRGEGFVVKSITTGRRFRRVIEAPTRRTLIIPEQKFASAEISLVKIAGDKTVSIGVGRVQKDIAKRDLVRFRSIAVGKTIGERTGIISGVKIGAEDIIAKGVVKTTSREGVRRFRITGEKPSDLNIQTAKQVALASTQTGIVGAITTPQVSRVGISQLGIPSTRIQIPTRKAQQIKTSTIKEAQIQRQQQIQTPRITARERARQVQRIIQPTAQRQRAIQITTQKAIQTPKITPRLRQPIAQRDIQTARLRTPLRQRQPPRAVPRPTIPKITTPPRTIAPLKIQTFRPRRVQPRARGLFGVQVRRRGTFRIIGKGLSFERAFQLGTARVRRTLGATFKITTPTGTGISQRITAPKGFRRRGQLFIERREQRLSTPSEVREIQIARLRV